VPEGYLETRASGKMQIRDPDVARRCEAIDCITRGPIFSWERWKNILRMNWSG